MKATLGICILLLAFGAMAQEEDSLVYYQAAAFQIIGKGFPGTESIYDRLPEHLKDTIRPVLWNLSKNSAGIAIRFCSNAG